MTSGFLVQRLGGCAAGACLLLTAVANAVAAVDTNVDICSEPADQTHVALAYFTDDKAAIDEAPGQIEQENFVADLLLRTDGNWSFGAGHRYTILDAGQLEPQTNGDLHTLFVALHRQSQSDGNRFRISVAPALSASSNVVKDPGEYSIDAAQLLAAVVWGKPLANTLNLRYGVCGDHRFGSYRVYPLVSVDWSPHADWAVELGFPTTQLRYQVSRDFSSSLRFTPAGNEWLVKDKSLSKQSRLVHEAYLLEWRVDWQAHEDVTVTASIGRRFHNRYEMTLLNDSRVQLATDPVTRVGAAVSWRF